MVRGEACYAIDRPPNGVRGIRDAERRPRVSARAVIGDTIASRAKGAMYDPLDAGAVQSDEGMRARETIQQVSHAPQVARAFFSHRRGEQDRSLGFHPRPDECLADRDERSQAARVVGDAGSLEPRPVTGDGHIELGSEHGVQMRRDHDGSVV